MAGWFTSTAARRSGLALTLAAAFAAAGLVAHASARVTEVVRNGTPHEALFDVAFDGAHGIAAGALGAVLESDDGGTSWHQATKPDTELALLGVALSQDRRVAVGQLGKVFVGNGESWHEADTGTEARLFSVAFVGPETLVAVGAFGAILRSADGGETWQAQETDWAAVLGDDFEPHLYDVTVAGDGSALVVGEFGLVLRSEDQGLTWQRANKSEASLFSLAFSGSHGIAVGQNGAVLRSDDDGRTWRPVRSGLDANLLGVWLGGSTAVVVGIRAAAISHDGGASWQALTTDGLNEGWHQAVAAAAPAKNGVRKVIAVGHAGRMVAID